MSGAFCQECAAFLLQAYASNSVFRGCENTKKNRPNFRWNGFLCSLTVSPPHRWCRCRRVRM